jgi:hypothetical protein
VSSSDKGGDATAPPSSGSPPANGTTPGATPPASAEARATDIHTTLASALPEAARAVIEEAHRARAEAKARAAAAATEIPTIEPAIIDQPPPTPRSGMMAASPIPPPTTGSSRPPPPVPKVGSSHPPRGTVANSKTLIGIAAGGPPPIVPRRRTPSGGTASPNHASTLIGMTGVVPRRMTPAGTPKVTPAAGTPPPPPLVITAKELLPPAAVTPDGGAIPGDGGTGKAARPKGDMPPVLRIPQGGMLGSSTPTKPFGTGSLLCEVLLRDGAVTQENIDRAIAVQEERGG